METAFGRLLSDTAQDAGFALSAAIDIEPTLASPLFSAHVEHFDQWLKEGSGGEMAYLARGRDRRADPKLVMRDARSMLCVAIPYRRRPWGSTDPHLGPRGARYLDGPDYHSELKNRLESLAMTVLQRWGSPLTWKVCIDTSAILERSWAAMAGLGWIGKNTLLIHPQEGSYLFLAEILFSESTGLGPRPLPDYCGNCNRCITACPTGALDRPRWLESRKCISYLSLEKRGPLSEEEPKSWSGFVAGCDLCQEVCPFNTKPVRSERSPLKTSNTPPDDWSWSELLRETREQYDARVENSSLNRIRYENFQRNLAIGLRSILENLSSGEKLAFLTLHSALLQARGLEPSLPDWVRTLWIDLFNHLTKP